MQREKKTEIIEQLQAELSGCDIGVLTDYRGLSNSEITALRRRIQESGGAYTVVKNTMARFAAERSGRADLAATFDGPVAIAFGHGDATGLPKVLEEFVRTAGTSISIKGGFLPDRMLTAVEVSQLAALPSREVLLAQVLGGLQAPIAGLIRCLASPLSGLAGVLQARIEQLEGE